MGPNFFLVLERVVGLVQVDEPCEVFGVGSYYVILIFVFLGRNVAPVLNVFYPHWGLEFDVYALLLERLEGQQLENEVVVELLGELNLESAEPSIRAAH